MPVKTQRYDTEQRRILSSILSSSPHALTPNDLLAQAKLQKPRIGIATVYRLLREMLADGSIEVVNLPGQSPRYEAVRHGHHHHFVCDACGQVFDLPGCVPGIEQLAPRDFSVSRHDLILYGQCKICRKSK